ncbi:MAG: phage tail tape measure protein [Comamonas sp.]|uniref:phage tail tape measure protein n=1 Tax=Comamonas sp. TaxID=34028 RepID=UPI002FC69B7F
MAFKPIQIVINAKDNASAVLGRLESTIKAVGIAAAGYFGINAFVGMVKGAADFEQGMSRVQAATGASADEMTKLRAAAEAAGADTKYTSTEAAGALENLAKAGLSANDAIAALPAVLQLAQAGDIELGAASEIVTKAVMGMGLAFTDAGRVADVLALGANATNTSVTGLAQALSYAAPVAQSLGLSLESTVAIIGKFADAGIDASRAGTALNSILSQFANPASKFREELATAGITTRNFEEALHQLAKAGPAGSKAINAVGQEAGPALRALLNQGMTSLDDLTAKLKNAEGSAAATAKVMQDNLHGSLNGLSSAWDTLKNALATPVLPVLKDGVDQLAASFKSAVADGTIGKFGDSIAAAFQAGIKWVKEFIGQVDFTQVVAKLSAFADRSNETFTQIGESARNAGNIVQTTWGVMTAGVNGLMAVIYKVGEAFAGVASNIQSGLAMLLEGLSKITFGEMSQSFARAAEEMRLSAEATWASSEALAAKASAALDAAADGAALAREGFASLSDSMSGASQATSSWQKTVEAARVELDASAKAAVNAAEAFQKKKAAEEAGAAASTAHRLAIEQLRGEYQTLIASGHLQAAAEKLDEINRKLRETPAAAKDSAKAVEDTAKAAEAAALKLQAAFTELGVTSSVEVAQQAKNHKDAYDTIKAAASSTTEDIAASFKKAADAAIGANKGIAPSWVAAEAAIRGYTIEVDGSGKSVLKLREELNKTADTSAKTSGAMTGHFGGVTNSINQSSAALLEYQQRMKETYGRPGEGAPKTTSTRGEKLGEGVEEIGSGGYQFRNRDGFTSDAKGNTQQQWVWTRTAIIDYLTEAGLDKLFAEDLSKQFLDADGKVGYLAGDAQKRWGGQHGTLADALGNLTDYYQYGDGKQEGAQRTAWLQGRQPGAKPPAPAPTPTPAPAPPSMFGSQSVTIDLRLDGASYGVIKTDSAGASTLQSLLAELERANRISSM